MTLYTYMLKMEDPNSGYKLTFDQDYHEVCQSLRNLHRHTDRIALGIALGLSYSTLLRMGSGDDFLNQIVAGWLKRQDDVLKHSGEPTWCVLADTLEKLGHKEIATDIRKRGGGPQDKGESEQQQDDGNPPPLSTNLPAHNNEWSSTNLSGQSCATPFDSNQSAAPISIESATQSKQDESHTSGVCPEQPPAPKRTKLYQQSIRDQSSNQQLPCATSKELKPVATLSHQAATTSITTSIVPSTTHLSAPQSCHNHPMALPNTGFQGPILTESIRAEEAAEAFREHRADLLVAVTDPLILANSLYSSRIISQETLDHVQLPILTPRSGNVGLFDAIESRIKTNPSDFCTILDIFNSDSQLHIFAERLQQSYHRMCTSNLRDNFESTSMMATMQLNKYLMDIYKSHANSCNTKFPHLPEKAFITLAIIEKESVSRANADTFTKGTLHGHADEILKKKIPIDMETVLEPPEGQQKNLKCVFVEGAPGIGKSTFALEFCRMQKKSRIYSLTLLLRLREKCVQSVKTIHDLFYQNTDLQQAVTKEVVACKGKNVLFILDGFDELPSNLRRESFIVELIQGINLPECTVLVTSRPSATAELNFSCSSQIQKRIEIIGFTHEHIKQYARSMLSDQPHVFGDFLKYISDNPAIYGMMYIPLNSAIVVEIYKDHSTTNKPIPCTLTQLYTELCFVLLKKYLIEKDDPQVYSLPDSCKFEQLSDYLKEQLIKLGKLAFEGALKQEITFDQLPDGCDHLGFMNVSTGLYLGDSKVLSYSFFHLTLQEFLAAFYLSQIQNIYEKKILFVEDLLFNENTRSSNLDVLWRFVAGLTEFKDIGWKLVCKATTSCTLTKEQLLTRNEVIPTQCYPLFYHCLMEVQKEEVIRSVFHDTLLPEQIQQINQIQNHDFYASAGTHFDCYALGYCVAASSCKWNVYITCDGGDETVKMLGCGLRSVGRVRGSLHSLFLSSNKLTHQGMTHLREFPCEILQNISILDLSENQLNDTAFDILADTLKHNMVSLIGLKISDNICHLTSDGWMVKLFEKLVGTKIYKLDLSNTMLGSSDTHALSPLINTQLKELIIGQCTMSSDSVQLMVQNILSSLSLEHVHIHSVQYTEKSASKFNLLEGNRKLVSLQFFDSLGLNLVVPHVANALHKNKTLKLLGMSCTENEDDEELDESDDDDHSKVHIGDNG